MDEKFAIARIFLKNILNLKSFTFQINEGGFEFFFKENSFKSKQVFISLNEIDKLFNSDSNKSILLITDRLNVHWSIVRTNNWITVIGPYKSVEFSKSKFSSILSKNSIFESLLVPFQLYYNSLSLLDETTVTSISYSFIEGLFGNTLNVDISEIDMTNENSLTENETFLKPGKLIEKLHDLEATYMEAISLGNTSEAIASLREIIQRTRQSENKNSPLIFPKVNSAISRTEARLVLKQLGVPSITLDAITSEYGKKVIAATSEDEIIKYQFEMTEVFCEIAKQFLAYPYSPTIRKAIHYININFTTKFYIQDIAQEIGLSPNRLSSKFHKETGETIKTYVNNLKLEMSTRLLSYTSDSIQTICSTIGVFDSNYFTKIFKEKYKLTPSQYREKHTKKYVQTENLGVYEF